MPTLRESARPTCYIADKRGITRPEVKAMVEKILGSEAVVKVVKAAEEKTPE